MIKLTRKEEPDILKNNKATWHQSLMAAIKQYGSYKQIPKDEKEKLTVHYREEDIKEALIKSSNGKCAFCECIPTEGGNIEVEHFKPKSIYPEYTFSWENLLPSCRLCNGMKLNHDTVKEPIVNPYTDNPEDFFYYELFKVKAKAGNNSKIGETTIEVCGLNTHRLFQPRANILVSLHDFEQDLGKAIRNYKDSNTERKKAIRIRNIKEAIDRIEALAKPSERYSSFCSHFLKNCQSYNDAKLLVDEYAEEFAA